MHRLLIRPWTVSRAALSGKSSYIKRSQFHLLPPESRIRAAVQCRSRKRSAGASAASGALAHASRKSRTALLSEHRSGRRLYRPPELRGRRKPKTGSRPATLQIIPVVWRTIDCEDEDRGRPFAPPNCKPQSFEAGPCSINCTAGDKPAPPASPPLLLQSAEAKKVRSILSHLILSI